MSNDFGHKIIEIRRANNLTQKQFADKLNVSDKAVSRWETGKNYPDIETLKAISAIFGISLDELLVKTTDTNNKESASRKKIIITAIIIILAVYFFPIHHFFYASQTSFYEAHDARMLLFKGFPTDRIKVNDVIRLAEEAFSEVGISESEAEEKYGKLSGYCYSKEVYPDVISEKHHFSVWSVRTHTEPTSPYDGYIWICYSQEGVDENGEVSSGSWKCTALWCLEKDGGTWKVADIIEGP